EDRLAGLLRFLHLWIVRRRALGHQLRKPAALVDLRAGHVDAVFAHALGELESGLPQLGFLLLVQLRRDPLEDALARLLRFLHLLFIAALRLEPEFAVHGVGHVDAVLAHALRVLELGLLPILLAGGTRAVGPRARRG